jgi:glycosyltransferase involved in cell wall biosynthesis
VSEQDGDLFLYSTPYAPLERRPRILFIASPAWLPQSTGGGSPMIAWSLERAFFDLGWDVSFLGLFKRERWPGPVQAERMIAAAGQKTKYWFAWRGAVSREVEAIRAVLVATNPDLIYCYGSEPAARARAAKSDALILTTFYDPPGLNGIYKRMAQLQYGTMLEKVRALRSIPRSVLRSMSMRQSDLQSIAAADIVVSHSYNHGRDYARKLGRQVEYFPNPLAVVDRPLRAPSLDPPVFLMAGNVTSTVSLTGFYFFCNRVLPHLKESLDRGDFKIRIVGGGILPERLSGELASVVGIEDAGRLSEEELISEYSRATALLVPTPIKLGFRTRIVDAFRYCVPAIVHSANRAGFHELESGRNCLMTSDGKEFARFVIDAGRNPTSLDGVGQTARAEFEERYSAEVFCQFIVDRTLKKGKRIA